MKFVEKTDGCWYWWGAHNKAGYGTFGVDGRVVNAHIVSWWIHVGPVPGGFELDHVKSRGCNSKDCVNPDHLELVTHKENMRRAQRLTCKNGHKFTKRNTIITSRGKRVCRICRRRYYIDVVIPRAKAKQ